MFKWYNTFNTNSSNIFFSVSSEVKITLLKDFLVNSIINVTGTKNE